MESETLGVYQLKRLLGRGGMGSVYLAHDPRLRRNVALKVLSPTLADEPQYRERFVSEARLCSALNHPNITTIHEIGEASGLHYIAFELVEGDTIERALARDGRFSPERVIAIAGALSGALAYAHERGIVHRDLKPANVVLTAHDTPKILDFGLAKAIPSASAGPENETLVRLTQAGMIVGTIAYMAPEQALGRAVDARSDVFSLGCLLYEMLVGAPPFSGATATQVIDRILHGEPQPIHEICPDVGRELDAIVDKTLQKKPDERYQSMTELEAALHRLDAGGRATPPAAKVKGHRPHLWLKVAASVGLFGAGALFINDEKRPPDRGHDTVAVMYFDNLSDPADSDQTGRMLSELLTSELAAYGDLHVLSRQRLYDVTRRLSKNVAEIDRSVATAVAEESGVRTMVLGQVARAGSRIMATTELVDVVTGRSLSSQRAGGSSAEDLFVLADALGEQVRDRLVVAPGDNTENVVAAVSVDAYRSYVEGETALHASDLDGAVESFEQAVRLAPEFALAYHRLSVAARWLSDGPLAHQAARRAVALIELAPAHLRTIIRANALYLDGAYSQVIPLLEELLTHDAENKEALYILSQIYVHSLRDGDLDRAIVLMERLLALDPGFHQVYDRLALSYAFKGELEKARKHMEAWEKTRPEEVLGLRSILATFEGQPEEALGFTRAFSWIEGPLFQADAAMLASRWDVARRLTDRDPDEWRSDHLRAWSLRNRGIFFAYVGELDRAVDYLRLSGTVSGVRTHEGGSAGVPASALQTLAELFHLSGDIGAARAETERALSMQPESWRGLYFAGRMALFDENVEAAKTYLARLRSLPAARTSASARVYVSALEGELALSAGDGEKAAAIFEKVVRGSLMLDWASTCSSAGAVIRDGLVRSYLAIGDNERARRAMEELLASGAERLDHPVVYVRTLYRLGVLDLDHGRAAEGKRLLVKLIDLWGSADWELEIVEDARKRLAS